MNTIPSSLDAAPEKAGQTSKRIMITIDTEAQPGRAPDRHVDRLIWGKQDEGDLGITKMMDIADRHNVKLCFFLDYAEYDLYGEELLNVGREIDRRGHDLELHIHPELIPSSFYKDKGLRAGRQFARLDASACQALAEHILDLHNRVSSRPAIAFRGGGYRFSPDILQALYAGGVKYSSNDNAYYDLGLLPPAIRAPFTWECGMVELPVSGVDGFLNLEGFLPYYFDMGALSNARYTLARCVSRHVKFVEKVFDEQAKGPCVMVLHSWSFQNKNEEGHIIVANVEAAQRFDRLLKKLLAEHEIITFRDLHDMEFGAVKSGEIFDKIEFSELGDAIDSVR